MPLKVVVELQVQAVTCPRVFLPEKHDVFLGVCILGQHKETECLPPVFPLLFYEKMCFEKVFESAIDPVAVTEMLESNVMRLELTQLVSSEGDDLAFYEENTRNFLFPECKLTPACPGVDRELLMKTSPRFPGIAPKIEFSTRTSITELPLQHRRKNYGRNRTRNQRSASPKQKNQSLTQCKTSVKRDKSYGRHTRSLKSQTPPLNTRDRFCELCRENHQQPSRLCLESAGRKSENETRPPFVVDSSKLFIEVTSPLCYRKVKQSIRSAKDSLKSHEKRASSFDNCEASNTSVKMIKEPSEQTTSEHDSSSLGRGGPLDIKVMSEQEGNPLGDSGAKRKSLIPFGMLCVGCCCRFRKTVNSSLDLSWEKINERVRNLLTSAQAKQRLVTGATMNETDDVVERTSVSLRHSMYEDSKK